MKKYAEIKKQLLSDPEVAKEYHALKSEFDPKDSFKSLRKLVGLISEGLPVDLSENHDEYLWGNVDKVSRRSRQ